MAGTSKNGFDRKWTRKLKIEPKFVYNHKNNRLRKEIRVFDGLCFELILASGESNFLPVLKALIKCTKSDYISRNPCSRDDYYHPWRLGEDFGG